QVREILTQVVGNREVEQPASQVSDFDRHARKHLLLNGSAELPIGGANAPACQQIRVDGRVEQLSAKTKIADLAAEVLATARVDRGRWSLREWIVEIAVGDPVRVRVGPGPCDRRR